MCQRGGRTAKITRPVPPPFPDESIGRCYLLFDYRLRKTGQIAPWERLIVWLKWEGESWLPCRRCGFFCGERFVASHRRVRLNQVLREAEGYLELDMPQHALDALQRLAETDFATSPTYYYLQGEALRATERFSEALLPLRKAADLAPGNIRLGQPR